ncbi:MAG: diaminopimelate decarboxylase, partial [Paramuribaculum sp.]|nr:diaminopimelate decarboxylase [Paramuribaculum sp.]
MHFPVELFRGVDTPFYYYDLDLLRRTLAAVTESVPGSNYKVHYAMKANANPAVLKEVREAGLGVDTVSGGEIEAAVAAGFAPEKIVFAGVGKSDAEIELALNAGIGNF